MTNNQARPAGCAARARRLRKRRRFGCLTLSLFAVLVFWNLDTVLAVIFPIPYGDTL